MYILHIDLPFETLVVTQWRVMIPNLHVLKQLHMKDTISTHPENQEKYHIPFIITFKLV